MATKKTVNDLFPLHDKSFYEELAKTHGLKIATRDVVNNGGSDMIDGILELIYDDGHVEYVRDRQCEF